MRCRNCLDVQRALNHGADQPIPCYLRTRPVKSPKFLSRSARPASFLSAAAERLEARIAPAVLVNPKTLTYFDTDGDLVTLTISKGTLTTADFLFDTAFDSPGPQQLQLVNFASDAPKAGADVSITAELTGVGNGIVNVGYLNATGIDLGKVTIDGDLGRLDAGNSDLTTFGVKRIEVGSMGAAGITTQAAGGNLTSHIKGPLNALITTDDVQTATLLISGAVGTIDIGGSVLGGDDVQSGAIRSGAIGLAHVGGDVMGGSGENSGQIFSVGNIGTVVIDGSIIGGTGAGTSAKSGMIFAGGTIGLAVIGHDIVGGSGVKSGQLASFAGMGVVQIAGSVRGGAGLESGAVGSHGPITKITVLQDLIGGDADDSSGALLCTGKIGKVEIGGDIEGGNAFRSGIVATKGGLGSVTVDGSLNGNNGNESGAIGSDGPIGSVTIMGNVNGGDGNASGHIVSKKSIGSVIVHGSVFGGFGDESGAIGALGTVKSVLVDGDVIGDSGNLSGWINSRTKLGTVTIGGALGFFAGESARHPIVEGVRPGQFGSGLVSAPVINTLIIGAIGSAEGFFDPGSVQGGAIGTITINDSIYSGFFSSAFIAARTIGTFSVVHNVIGRSGQFQGKVEIDVRNSLGKLTIGGNAEYLSVVAGGGFDPTESPANPDAQIGVIKVSGDLTASSAVAGVFAGKDGIFGSLDDVIVKGGNPNVISTIARIQIDGQILDDDSGIPFGYVAQHLKALSVGGSNVPLAAGPNNDSFFLKTSAPVFVRENNKTLSLG
jgi:hypothetical protein